jgi:hypothetical protein
LLRAEVEKFKRDWEDNAASDPDAWPMEMPEGEWFEHFITQAIAA